MHVILQEQPPIPFENYVQDLIKSFSKTEINEDFLEKVKSSKKDFGAYLYPFEIIVVTDEKGNIVNLKWRIVRRYKDIIQAINQCEKLLKQKKIRNILPWKPPKEIEDPLLRSKEVKSRLTYLLSELKKADLIYQPLHDFLEISTYNIVNKGLRYKEGYLEKHHGGHFKENCFIKSFNACCFGRKAKRWFVIVKEGVIYCNSSKDQAERSLSVFDNYFELIYGPKQMKNSQKILLNTQTRQLNLKCPTLFDTCEWLIALNKAIENCDYMQNLAFKRYLSFAPIRENCQAKFYIDGEEYFKDVYEALNQAKKEIYITDWFFSPELYLLRPVTSELNQETRLDKTLKRAADRGAKIYIILFKESPYALPNNSARVKRLLERLSSNIRVHRHPNTAINYWSHHEKIIVIDQLIAFAGGLDLCFGRFDNNHHKLSDEPFLQGNGEFWPGQDYSNVRLKDFIRNSNPLQSLIEKRNDPRLPWHDIALKTRGTVVKDFARHFMQYWNFTNIISKKAFIKPEITTKVNQINKSMFPQTYVKKSITTSYLEDMKNQKEKEIELNIQASTKVPYIKEIKNKDDIEHEKMVHIYMEKTMKVNQVSKPKDLKEIQNYGNDEMDENNVESSLKPYNLSKKKENDLELNIPMMVSKIVEPTDKIYNKIMLKEIQQPNVINLEAPKDKNSPKFENNLAPSQNQVNDSNEFQSNNQDLYNMLTTAIHIANEKDIENEDLINNISKNNIGLEPDMDTYMDMDTSINNVQKSIMSKVRQKFSKRKRDISRSSISKERKTHDENDFNIHLNLNEEKIAGSCVCQVLRSATSWSLGLKSAETENSIHVAYLQLITQAEHFIYIENQFFMSQNAGDPIVNQISKALILRIKKAAKAKQNFKVFVVLPLLPGFEGDIDKSPILQRQLYWQYKTICRGSDSIYSMLNYDPDILDPDQYISFYGLRNHGKVNGMPVTEQIYVHSKLMIIDDKIALIGSANINDRSLLGKRDSEICAVVEDKASVTSKMNGKEFKASKFAHELRTQLFQEHFGMSKEEVLDPLDSIFLQKLALRAKINTQIYREIFRCIPDDQVRKFDEIQNFTKEISLTIYEQRINDIIGHIVEFPLKFLEREHLNPFSKETILPEIIFTQQQKLY